MAVSTLSQIASGGAVAGATDKVVAVRSGTTDLLVTPVALDTSQSWLAAQTTSLAVAASSTDGFILTTSTAATNNNQKWSPRIRLTGNAWNTGSGGSSQAVDWIAENRPTQLTTTPYAILAFANQINGGGYTDILTLSSKAVPAGIGFFNLVGTHSTGTSLNQIGAFVTITSAGSTIFASQAAMAVTLLSGYTGQGYTYGLEITNQACSTSTGGLGTGTVGNWGISSVSAGTTAGWRFGALLEGRDSTSLNMGAFCQANTAVDNATNIAVGGFALNTGASPVQIAGYFALTGSIAAPTNSAALVCDNAATSSPVALFQVNTVTKVQVTSLGSLVVGSAALNTNATDGFSYLPSCAGTPTGSPTAFTGTVPFVYDSTNNIIYINNGSWKKTVALT